MMQALRHPGLRAFAAAVAMLATFCLAQIAPASAEVKKFMLLCSGKLCPLFLPQLPEPAGWSVAFGEDTDREGNLFGVQIVLTTASDEALANNENVFFTVLKDY